MSKATGVSRNHGFFELTHSYPLSHAPLQTYPHIISGREMLIPTPISPTHSSSSSHTSVYSLLSVIRPMYPFSSADIVPFFTVDVTLNPHTANLNLVLSKNRRQVRFVGAQLSGSHLKEHYDCGILGSQHFSSGKHYWEVDVAKKTDWILGVCSNTEGPPFSFNQFINNQNVYSRYQPQSGYWVIGLHHKHEYRAYEESSASLLLSMMVPPRRIGIFLDYEAGTVSFFNVTNHGFPIYTFSKYYFPTTLCPYFNPCNCVVPMTLRRPSS